MGAREQKLAEQLEFRPRSTNAKANKDLITLFVFLHLTVNSHGLMIRRIGRPSQRPRLGTMGSAELVWCRIPLQTNPPSFTMP